MTYCSQKYQAILSSCANEQLSLERTRPRLRPCIQFLLYIHGSERWKHKWCYREEPVKLQKSTRTDLEPEPVWWKRGINQRFQVTLSSLIICLLLRPLDSTCRAGTGDVFKAYSHCLCLTSTFFSESLLQIQMPCCLNPTQI